ncbi:hypothetical protein [Peribacillus frigoritolerans]|uniref:hypothetical protein n=1 Tax=Peribacillus frigoritolerans TaxID=450367 RepID=UPI0031D1AA6D
MDIIKIIDLLILLILVPSFYQPLNLLSYQEVFACISNEILDNVSAFFYDDNRLDGMRGRHSIWRRWGQYPEQYIEEIPYFMQQLSSSE